MRDQDVPKVGVGIIIVVRRYGGRWREAETAGILAWMTE